MDNNELTYEYLNSLTEDELTQLLLNDPKFFNNLFSFQPEPLPVVQDPSLGQIFGAGVDNIQAAGLTLGQEAAVELSDSLEGVALSEKVPESIRRLSGEVSDDLEILAAKAGIQAQENQRDAAAILQGSKTFTDLRGAFTEAPLKTTSEFLALQAPQVLGLMAASLGGGPLALATSGLYFTGTNLQRQKDEDPTKFRDADGLKAFGTGIAQAGLESLFVNRLFPGLMSPVTKGATTEATKQVSGSLLKDLSKKAAQAVALGSSTEVVQQGLERIQAGLPIGDEKATKEYLDSAFGGALLGGIGAPFSVALERLQTKQKEPTPENLLEEKAQTEVPDIVSVPNSDLTIDLSEPERISPVIDNQAKFTLQSLGFNPEKFSDSRSRIKAATLALKNVSSTMETDQTKTLLQKTIGNKELVDAYLKQNPDGLKGKPVETLVTTITNKAKELGFDGVKALSSREAVDLLQKTMSAEQRNLKEATDLVFNNQSIDAKDVDTQALKQEFQQVFEQMKRRVVDFNRFGKRVNTAVQRDEKKNRPILSVDKNRIKNTIAENIQKEGYTEFFTPDTTNEQDTLTTQDLVYSGQDPSNVLMNLTNSKGLDYTIDTFAENQKTALDAKERQKQVVDNYLGSRVPQATFDPQATTVQGLDKLPIDFRKEVRPDLDVVQPIADSLTLTEPTLQYISNVLGTVAQRVNLSQKRGVKDLKGFMDKVRANPLTKVRTAIFTNTLLKLNSDPNSVDDTEVTELFHFLFDNTSLLNANQKKALQRVKKPTLERFAKEFDLSVEDLQYTQDSPEFYKDVLANLFNEYRKNRRQGVQYFPQEVKTVLRIMDKAVNDISKEFKKVNISNFSSLFPNDGTTDLDALIKIQDIRNDKMVMEQLNKVIAQDMRTVEDFDREFAITETEFQKQATESASSFKQLLRKLFAKRQYFTAVLARAARQNNVMAYVDALRAAQESRADVHRQELDEAGGQVLRNIYRRNQQAVEKAYDYRARHAEGRMPEVSPDGRSITYYLRGTLDTDPIKKVVINDVDVVQANQAFQGIQNLSIKKLTEQAVIRPLSRIFTEPQTITIDFLEKLSNELQTRIDIEKLSPDSDTKQQSLQNYAEKKKIIDGALDAMVQIRSYEKTPYVNMSTREGNYGLSLYYAPIDPKTGKRSKVTKQVGLFGVRSGSAMDNFKNRYSKQDLEFEVGRIRNLVDNHPDPDGFYLLGDVDGDKLDLTKRKRIPAKNLTIDKVQPVELTKNRILQETPDLKRRGNVLIENLFDLFLIEGDKEVAKALELLNDKRTAINFNLQFLLPSKRMYGYRTNPIVALENHLNSWSHYLSDAEFSPQFDGLVKELDRAGFFNTDINPYGKFYRDIIEFQNEPAGLAGYIRGLDYFLALGGRISTAVLQLTQLATTVPVEIMRGLGPVLGTRVLRKSVKSMGEYSKLALEIRNKNNNKTLSQTIQENKTLDEGTKRLLKQLGIEQTVGGLFAQDAQKQLLEQDKDFGTKQSKVGTAWKKTKSNVLAGAGFPMGLTETIGRLTALDAFSRALRDKNFFKLKYRQIKDDPKFVQMQRVFSNQGLSTQDLIAKFLLDEHFGVSGKRGRPAYISRNPILALVYSFASFPIQMASAFVSMFSRDPRLALYTALAFWAIGGLKAIPFFQDINDISKLLYKFYGKNSDLEFEIREMIRRNVGQEGAEFDKMFSKGPLAYLFGVDIGGRLGIRTPGLSQALNFVSAQGQNQTPLDLTVAGGVFNQILDSTIRTAQGESVPIENFIPILAIKDVAKAIRTQTSPVTTKSGTVLLPPQKGDLSYMLPTAIGFKAMEEAMAQDAVFFNMRVEQSPALQQKRKQLRSAVFNILRSEGTNPVDAQKYRNKFNDILKEILLLKAEKGLDLDASQEIERAREWATQAQTGEFDYESVPERRRLDAIMMNKFYAKPNE